MPLDTAGASESAKAIHSSAAPGRFTGDASTRWRLWTPSTAHLVTHGAQLSELVLVYVFVLDVELELVLVRTTGFPEKRRFAAVKQCARPRDDRQSTAVDRRHGQRSGVLRLAHHRRGGGISGPRAPEADSASLHRSRQVFRRGAEWRRFLDAITRERAPSTEREQHRARKGARAGERRAWMLIDWRWATRRGASGKSPSPCRGTARSACGTRRRHR